MYYPEELVEEIRERNDIVDVISSYVRISRKGSNYVGLCPFHNEKTGSFSVSPSKQMFYCFGCHEGGNVITFLEKYENLTFTEALKSLAGRVGVELPDNSTKEDRVRESRRSRLLDINKEAGKYYYYQLRSPDGKKAYEYLTGRGLSDDTIKRFGLGYARSSYNGTYNYLKSKGFSDDLLNASGLFNFREGRGMMDKFYSRAIFPIMDANNRIVAFGGRIMGEGEPKYLNSPETEVYNKSRVLYGMHIAKSSRARNIIICEGYMDAIALHQAGFDQAVASLGTALTSGHVGLVMRYARENQNRDEAARYKDVLLCFDSDHAGIDAAKRGIREFKKEGIVPKVINLKPYKDPDEFIGHLGREEFEKRIEEAENGFMFEIRMLEEEYDLKDPSGKSRFLDDAARRTAAFENPIERDMYIAMVADKYMVGADTLKERVKKFAMIDAGVTLPPAIKSSRNIKNSSGDEAKRIQGTLLNWLCEKPSIYPEVKKHISPDDFKEGTYRDIAKLLFEQLEGGRPEPARIISMFADDEEEQKTAAELLSQGAEYIEDTSDADKALKNLMLKIKESSLKNNDSENAAGEEEDSEEDPLAKALRRRKNLESLRNTDIKLKTQT